LAARREVRSWRSQALRRVTRKWKRRKSFLRPDVIGHLRRIDITPKRLRRFRTFGSPKNLLRLVERLQIRSTITGPQLLAGYEQTRLSSRVHAVFHTAVGPWRRRETRGAYSRPRRIAAITRGLRRPCITATTRRVGYEVIPRVGEAQRARG